MESTTFKTATSTSKLRANLHLCQVRFHGRMTLILRSPHIKGFLGGQPRQDCRSKGVCTLVQGLQGTGAQVPFGRK